MIKALGIMGATLVMVLGFMLVRDPGYIPPFDANRIQLVDSEASAACAAKVFAENPSMTGGPDMTPVKECVASSDKDTEPNLQVVQRQWCETFVAQGTWNGTVDDCLQIMEGNKFWPNMRAGLSNQWNSTFPYPGSILNVDTDTRAADRPTTDRKELPDDRS